MANRIQRGRIFIGFSTVDVPITNTRLYDIELVKRDLKNHFMTSKGERIMKPNFGSIIWDLLFEPYDETIEERIKSDVTTIINADPRVELIDMQVTNEEYGITVQATLQYNPFAVTDSLYVRYIRDNFSNSEASTNRSFAEDL